MSAPATCSIEGCDAQHSARGWCLKHYTRWRRHGSPDRVLKVKRPARGICAFDGCEKPDCGQNGYCTTHYTRMVRHGDVNVVKQAVHYSGEEHPNWVGADASYSAVHDRLRRDRGNASDHPCLHCGRVAAEWAYDHSDPDEKTGDQGCLYSTDPDRYIPLCTLCHRRFDLDWRRRSQPEVTSCKAGHDWTNPRNVRVRDTGRRECAECARIAALDRYYRRKAAVA